MLFEMYKSETNQSESMIYYSSMIYYRPVHTI